jgi:hypothetical protein
VALCKIYICPHNVFLHTPRCSTVSRPAPWAPLTAFQPYIGQTRPSCDRVFRTPLELPFVTAPCDYLVNLPKPKHFRDIRPANFRRPCPCTSQVPVPFPVAGTAHANVYFNRTSPHALSHHDLRSQDSSFQDEPVRCTNQPTNHTKNLRIQGI